MFSFTLVLFMLWLIDTLKEKLPKIAWYSVSFVIVAVMCLVAMFTGVDYEHHAILTGYFSIFFTSDGCLPFHSV